MKQTTKRGAHGPPYRQIADEIRRRITAGELVAGDRIPSTRRLVAEWGVAIATATKALALLRNEGLIHAMPRVGSVVAARRHAPPPGGRASRRDSEPAAELTRERIARAAIALADAEGLAALSMRGIAAKLEVPTMSLYRHVEHKDALVLLMIDAVFGAQPPPAKPPAGWRARLELLARRQWALYRRHPWLAQLVTITRPLPLRNVIVHADWMLRALDGLGLDAATMLHAHITLYSYVRGIAVNLESERQAEAETGLTEAQWTASQAAAFDALVASGEVPTFARVLRDLAGGFDLDLDAVFEFGLAPLLDGLAVLIRSHAKR